MPLSSVSSSKRNERHLTRKQLHRHKSGGGEKSKAFSTYLIIMTVIALIVVYQLMAMAHLARSHKKSDARRLGKNQLSLLHQQSHSINLQRDRKAGSTKKKNVVDTVVDKAKGEDQKETEEPENWDDDNVEVNRLWFGRPPSSIVDSVDLSAIPISVVLSYCEGDLQWLPKYMSGVKFNNFTVLAKCGTRPNIAYLPPEVQIIEMKNVGRCDHNVAHWMGNVLPEQKDADENEVIVFLKDNMIVHQEGQFRNISTMLATTVADGIGCGLEPSRGISVYHVTKELKKFNLEHYFGSSGEVKPEPVPFKSKYENMGGWLRDMGITLPEPLSPVCYGGVFAVRRSQISRVPRTIWQNMERSLSRGDNIEEGHFAERTWSGLLHRSLTESEITLLKVRCDSVYSWTNAMVGALMKGE